MPEKLPELRRGRIVWADVRDQRGSLKRRPAIIITATSAIKPERPLAVIAITTTYPDPPPADHVELPWEARRHPVTRLTKRSAAVVSWFGKVKADEVEPIGDVPTKQMKMIEAKLAELKQSYPPEPT